jgi:perosamine synthetase
MKIAQYEPKYTVEDKKALHELIDSDSWFSEFKYVEEFERMLAKQTGNEYAIAVNNGTVAISIVLSALGIRPYDQVIVPDMTMIATANAVSFIGATPVFADIELDTGCLDVDKAIALAESVDARAIIYVTLNGRMNEQAILKLKKYCDDNYIHLIKDDAQSLGSYSDSGLPLQDSSFANTHTLSFSPHKAVSTGQGGAIVTSDEKLYEAYKRMKDFGRLTGGADNHDYFGINSKFTELQASLGISQLKRFDQIIRDKRFIYDSYAERLDRDSTNIYIKPRNNNTTPWFVDLYIKENLQGLAEHLKNNGIGTRKIYPALQNQLCYDKFHNVQIGFKPEYSVMLSETVLWLPSSLTLTEDDINKVCDKILEFYK